MIRPPLVWQNATARLPECHISISEIADEASTTTGRKHSNPPSLLQEIDLFEGATAPLTTVIPYHHQIREERIN